MQTTLIALFLFSLAMGVTCFVIGYLRPPRPGIWMSRAGFLIWLVLLAPFLTFVLYHQHGAVPRLERTGFVIHPAIVEAVGMANGTGNDPTWLFRAKGAPDSILGYYRSPNTHPGWFLMAETPQLLTFGNGHERMHIFTSKGWRGTNVMYKMETGD